MPSTTPPPRWTSWSSENRGLTADLTAGRRLVSRPRLPGWASPWLLLTPALILLCVLVLLPYAGALLFSVTDGRLITIGTLPRLVGLSNFEKVISSTGPEFGLVVAASAVFTLGTLVGSLGLGTLLGLAVTSLRPKLRGPLLALLLVPWIIAGVVVGYTWKLVYDPQIGLANAMLVPLGVGRVAWLLERWPAIAALVVANVWAAYGVVLLVVSSALTNVPQSLILAGQVDGAGTLTIIRRIVLPNIRRAFLLAALVAVVSGLNVFDLIFVMTGGGPTYQTETLALTMYRLTFRRGDIGEGAAVTVMLFCFSLALAIVYVWSWQREARKWR